MPQPMGFQIRLGWSGWFALLLALGIVLGLAVVVTILFLGVFIILLPVIVISAVLYYLFPSLRYRRPHQAREREIIEGDYRVVDPTRRELDAPPSDRT